MRVVQTRNHTASLEVDDLGARTAQGHRLGIGANRDEAAFVDSHGAGQGFFTVNGMELTIEQNQIGVHRVSFDRVRVRKDRQGIRQYARFRRNDH